MEEKTKLLFIGRFQPFHTAHLEMMVNTNKHLTEHIIAIGSAQESHTERNPFTYCEREKMIRLAWKDANMRESHLKIVPLPDINDPENWVDYVIKVVPDFDVVVTNNTETENLFRSKNYSVSMADVNPALPRGTYVRAMMKEGRPWSHLVSPSVAKYIKSIKGEERIRKKEEK